METKNIIFLIIFIAAFVILFFSLRKFLKHLSIGQKENRSNRIVERIINVLKIAFLQSKLLRYRIAGIIHFFIFWGFIVFLLAVLEAIIQGFYTQFSFQFLGRLYKIITLIQDIFILLVFFAVLTALFRRFVLRVKRLEVDIKGKIDATVILLLILLVVITMLGMNVSILKTNNFAFSPNEFKPISMFVAETFFKNSNADLSGMTEIFWWAHIIVIFFFMNYLPYSKHFHVYTSIPNVFLGKVGEHKYALKKLNLEDENAEQFGVLDVEHLTWKQILDGYSCTECGRCTENCPANITGKKLSPKEIMRNIRKRHHEKAPLILKKDETNKEILEKTLLHNYITDEEIWACTTCNSCVIECPVMNEHVDAIVDMRRNLVLMESNFPNELNPIFKNLETNFSPWAFNPQDRANWAEGMEIKTMAEDSNCDLLFWVGCAGSYDARYQKVTKAFATILKNAGVDFRILGIEEKCNGDTARRLGNEYLAQMLIQENVETLNNYRVKKIVTTCPHCFNTLKHDYPTFGGNFEVIHHTELIQQLIKENKIKIKDEKLKEKITYHDSCYLGRYNGIYDQPREILNSVIENKLLEMDRKRDKAFCCGAGGGRMFLEENEGTRINNNRTKEAIDTGCSTIAAACPFCITMFEDGLKEYNKEEEIKVKDIAEIVSELVGIRD
ncbi:MAG: 4Fe-4S dicluster domain-containing protein [Ignavibacteriales bacterium]|nr:4Fe-4S dicluster domain-containing protein [Ignavibacteriales bacterium]